jgi:hypothetical protein
MRVGCPESDDRLIVSEVISEYNRTATGDCRSPAERDDPKTRAQLQSILCSDGNRMDLFNKGAGYIDAGGVKRWNWGVLDMVMANVKSTA